MNLNAEQKLAVEHFEGPCVVTAVPGSGKTATLTSRVVHLIKNRGINPRNILCLTFTNKAAEEMRQRVAGNVGQDASSVWISTFHALCLAILRKYGSEVGLSKGFSIYCEKDQKELLGKISRMKELELNPKQIGEIAKAVNDFREEIEDFEKFTSSFPPVWREVMQEYLATLDEFNAVDFSGILYKTWLLFLKKPEAAGNLHELFSFVMIDEMQDTNTIQYEIVRAIADPQKTREGNLFCVGDYNQCLHEDELIEVYDKKGNKQVYRAADAPKHGLIKSYRNGKITQQEYVATKSDATRGVKIVLESLRPETGCVENRSLSVSDKHKVYCSEIKCGGDDVLVYLMYRPDLGFRVGSTKNNKTQYGHRMTSELATKFWVLEVCNDHESALLEEQRISLTFGVPTAVFNGTSRGINQDRINALFDEFGKNGKAVLDHYGLSFDYPLWSAQSCTTNRYSRTQIHLCAHSAKGSQVSCEWSDPSQSVRVAELGVSVTEAKSSKNLKRWRCRKFFSRYTDASRFAESLALIFDGNISERIRFNNERLFLTTASAVRKGCYLPVLKGDGRIELQRVIRVEPLSGRFVSLEVDDSSLFFNADNILSHNSIFAFRGARPENIQRVSQDFDNVRNIVLPRNYRSTSQILAAAERLIRHNDNAKDVELISERGPGESIYFRQYSHPEEEADYVAREIKTRVREGSYKYSDVAILYRTNELSKAPEMFLRRYGIPYRIVGGFSFYDRSEIKTAIAYLSFLANPSDTVSFARLIKSPRRGVGEVVVGRLERHCREKNVSMLEACKNIDAISGVSVLAKTGINRLVATIQKWKNQESSGVPIGAIAIGLFSETGFLHFVEHEMKKDEEDNSRLANVEQLLVGITDFEKQKPQARLEDFLQSIQLLSSLDENDSDDEKVSLLTMHSAKGLEFPIVYVIGCEEGLVPHRFARSPREVAEERRLMYVAVTRAKDRLCLARCKFRTKFNTKQQRRYIDEAKPSSFLAELSG